MLCYIPTIGHSKIYFWLITDRVSEEGIKFGRVRPFVCNFVSARTAWPPDRRPWCFCVCIGRDHDDRSSPGIANPGRRSTLGVSKDGNAVGRSILELDRRQFLWLIGLIYCVIILTVLHNQALTFSVDIFRPPFWGLHQDHRGRTGYETWSHRYICAARWPLESNRIIWWAQVLRTEI